MSAIYKNGTWYGGDSGTESTQVKTLPAAAANLVGTIYQYIGTTNENYTNGFFYKCVSDGESTPTYSWTVVNVQAASSSVSPYTSAPEMDGTASAGSSDDYARGDHVHPSDTTKENSFRYSTMPTASATNEGAIVQYIGATTSTYTNGYFYKCVSDGESTPTYSWSNINVQAGGGSGTEEIFVGTIDEWNALTTSEKESYSLVLIKPKEFVVGNVYTLNEKTFICARELDDDVFALQANTSWGTVAYIRSGKNTGDRINVNLVDSYTQAANWYTSDVQAIEADSYKYGPHWVSVGDATSASYKYNDGLKAAYGWTGSSTSGGNSHYAINSDGAAVSLDTAFSPRSAGLAPAFNVDATKAVIGLNNVVTAGTPEHIDHLYTYNSETGELESIPHRITSEEMSEIVSPLPAAQRVMPIGFDESGAEYVVSYYKRASDGKKKPIYEKCYGYTGVNINGGQGATAPCSSDLISANAERVIKASLYIKQSGDHSIALPCGIWFDSVWQYTTGSSIFAFSNTNCFFILQYTKTTDTWQ